MPQGEAVAETAAAHSIIGTCKRHNQHVRTLDLVCQGVGEGGYRHMINAIETMDITEEDKKRIYGDNARKLMRLPI